MERARQVCLIVLLLIGMISPGCKRQRATDPGLEIEKESARRGTEAYRKYRTADYPTAKSALQDYLRFLDKVSSGPNPADEFREDALTTCVRLAKLEEKNHGSEQAAYMKEAVARCQKFKVYMGGCSEENLRKGTDRLDEFSPK